MATDRRKALANVWPTGHVSGAIGWWKSHTCSERLWEWSSDVPVRFLGGTMLRGARSALDAGQRNEPFLAHGGCDMLKSALSLLGEDPTA